MTTWSAIAAVDHRWLIGADGRIPWHLPADLRRFKQVTMGKPMIMGRKTHESIGRCLPGRRNIILTRQPDYVPAPGGEVVGDLAAARAVVEDEDEAMVIGGAGVYEAFLPYIDRFYLTVVEGSFDGDTYLTGLSAQGWEVTAREDVAADERNPHAHAYLELERVLGTPGKACVIEVPDAWRYVG